jgi:Ca2+:H+ antiporter
LVTYSIALQEGQIRIVQASLLGSILANLLLILGMCFLVGGLRFREQIYNSTVTQMSACLLSLSVMSLLLPTAFHAAFADNAQDSANTAVLQVSRGTAFILLLVYGMYLLFQLKSHAYMYESTPQHIIDEELAPGPVAAWMDSSSSSDDSSSDDSDDSRDSHTTAGRIKRVMRAGRRRRKSSATSKDAELPEKPIRTPSYGTGNGSVEEHDAGPSMAPVSPMAHRFGAFDLGDEADTEVAVHERSRTHSIAELEGKLKKGRKHKKKHHKKKKDASSPVDNPVIEEVNNEKIPDGFEPRRVDFAVSDLEAQTVDPVQKKAPFTLRGIRPAMPKTFSQTVFSQPSPSASQSLGFSTPAVTGPIPRVRYGIRRTNSLPDRLNQMPSNPQLGAGPPVRQASTIPVPVDEEEDEEENISRTTAVVLLLVSTGLVALCAEFMVASISSVTANTALGETFVGLIILPIVGNAAEHVTAVTVASKNKMDLAIGVAVGSSIQIALFVTPFVVLLGWCMGKDMSLYFTLFETVSLFVATFIVNFLILDGRSNYLEGALLCSTYIIIAVAAYFYPATGEQSVLGGNPDAGSKMIRSLLFGEGLGA